MKKQERTRKALRIAGIFLVLAAAAGGVFYGKTRPVQYHAAQLQQGTLERTLEASGDVKTEESRTYYAAVSATVSMLEVEEGDEVAEGELLAAFDLEDLTRNQKEAALRMQQADSSYQSVIKQNEKNTLIYQGAAMTETMFCELISKQWELISNLEKKIAKTEVKANDINWLTSRAALDTDEDDRDDFAAGIDAWRKEYDAMDVPRLKAELIKEQAIYSDMQAFRAQYATLRDNADARLVDESAQQELLLKKQEAALGNEEAKSNLQDAQLGVHALFHGIVRERFVESGAAVTEGDPLFVIDGLDTLYVAAEISKYDIDQVKVGQQAVIRIGEKQYQGKVTRIERIASKDHSDKAKIPVHICFQGDSRDVCLGIEADVEIMLEKQEDAQLLDRRAVYEDENGTYVYVIAEGAVQRRSITAEKSNELWYAVTDGIKPEEWVIVDAVTDADIGKMAVGIADESLEEN